MVKYYINSIQYEYIPEWLEDFIQCVQMKVYRSYMRVLDIDSSMITNSLSVKRETENKAMTLIHGYNLGKVNEDTFRAYKNGEFIIIDW